MHLLLTSSVKQLHTQLLLQGLLLLWHWLQFLQGIFCSPALCATAAAAAAAGLLSCSE
jgi:hypothetical protein